MAKGRPSSSTVSTPRCTSTSKPESVLKPRACPVSAAMVTVPLTGASTSPVDGSDTPKPSPTIFPEKTGSGTSAMPMIVPPTGASSSSRGESVSDAMTMVLFVEGRDCGAGFPRRTACAQCSGASSPGAFDPSHV
ncbi:Uncharacterised protein [Mycobacteroides abscessus subsp. abscessus]|nr:Uncharacterised protein [Mycobacteroides abscessus subsp. abscessus]